MELDEALQILSNNNILVETLTANPDKLFYFYNQFLKRIGQYDPSKLKTANRVLRGNKDGGFALMKNNGICDKFPLDSELKAICDKAGYYCNRTAVDIYYITPKTHFKTKNNPSSRTYYHVSKCPTLDKTGIRIRDRMHDDTFDIYEGRIYLSTVKKERIKSLIRMVTKEHRMRAEDICLYEVSLPEGYEAYQDPTYGPAIYVTNSIPAKYVKKLDIKDFLTDKEYTKFNKKLDFRKDKMFLFKVTIALNYFTGYKNGNTIFNIAKEKFGDMIQQLYEENKTANYIAKKITLMINDYK